MTASTSVLGVGILDDAAFDARVRGLEVVTVEASGPQAIRIVACAEVAGAKVEREVLRYGRCTSARRERLTVRRADVDTILRGLSATASFFFANGRVRDGHEMAGTAQLLTEAAS